MGIIFGRKCPCAIAHELHPHCFSSHFFFSLFTFDLLGRLVQYSFFWFRCDFLFFMDMIFLLNLGNWFFFFFVYHFFGFNWASFFNKGICVNLYKLTFSISQFFHFQPNKNEENWNIFYHPIFLFSYHFLSSHFSTPPTKWTLKEKKKKLRRKKNKIKWLTMK